MIGDGTTIQRDVLTQVGNLTNWQFATTGAYHTIGLKTDGSLSRWGYNFYGELGVGNNSISLIPISTACLTMGTVKNEIDKSFTIYPNPSNSVLNIISNENEIENCTVVDLMGKVIIHQKNNSTQINVQNLESGIYFVSVTINGITNFQKFIKE